jgi:hypothetical protein
MVRERVISTDQVYNTEEEYMTVNAAGGRSLVAR